MKLNNKDKMVSLLRDYGYPEKAIHRFMQEAKDMDYEEMRKSIMPYQDITAHRE